MLNIIRSTDVLEVGILELFLSLMPLSYFILLLLKDCVSKIGCSGLRVAGVVC